MRKEYNSIKLRMSNYYNQYGKSNKNIINSKRSKR